MPTSRRSTVRLLLLTSGSANSVRTCENSSGSRVPIALSMPLSLSLSVASCTTAVGLMGVKGGDMGDTGDVGSGTVLHGGVSASAGVSWIGGRGMPVCEGGVRGYGILVKYLLSSGCILMGRLSSGVLAAQVWLVEYGLT